MGQSFQRMIRDIGLSLLCLSANAALAQAPSYVGPWSYRMENLNVNTSSPTEEEAARAFEKQENESGGGAVICNAAVAPKTEFAPVEYISGTS